MPTGDFVCSVCGMWLALHRDMMPCRVVAAARPFGPLFAVALFPDDPSLFGDFLAALCEYGCEP